MGLFDFLFGSRTPEAQSPDQLQDLLFGAAQAGDGKLLERLCRANRAAIAENFPRWQKVPEGVRNDPAAVQRYAQGLIAVAQTFADRLGSPELLERLTGSQQSNPLARWQERLQEAQGLMADLRYREARDLLADLLIDVRGLRGTGVDTYLPVTLGYLGECYFQGREAEKAVPHWEQALRLCEQHDDLAGVAAYLGNLYEAHRCLGRPEPAASSAERLADAFEGQGRTDEVRRYRRQAGIVRAGEPLNRVVAVVDGRHYELDEVGPIRVGKVQLVFERNRVTLRPATVLTQQGETLGGASRYEEALDAFRAAARSDPLDPHARYEEGLTLLYLRRYAEAVDSYEAAEGLAPGWFHCRADLWLARELALGHLGHELFLALRALEDGSLPPAEKVRLAEQGLGAAPGLMPLHLFRGKGLAGLGRVREAEAAYRRGLSCPGDPDVKTRLLVELGLTVTSAEEKRRLLTEARELNGNLVAAAMATLALRQ
jgi:tetratricopeptide (TPR) repeat protein